MYFAKRVTLSRLAVYAIPVAVLIPAISWGQAYPSKPVRIVAAEAGGGNDTALRMMAQPLSGGLGQQVIVENRGGTFGAGAAVAKAPPDGYTLLYFGGGLWLLPLMRNDVPFEAERDFTAIVLTTRNYSVLVVHPSLPVRSVKELIALAKARPGQLNYSSAAAGSTNHLAPELLKHMAGLDIVRVGYKGVASAATALLSGEVQIMFPTASSVVPYIKSGRMRALAITSAQPSALYPELPTMASSGLPGFDIASIAGLFAPTRTPAAIIMRLNQEMGQVLARPEIRDGLVKFGFDVVGGPPEVLANTVRTEVSVLGKVIKAANIRDE